MEFGVVCCNDAAAGRDEVRELAQDVERGIAFELGGFSIDRVHEDAPAVVRLDGLPEDPFLGAEDVEGVDDRPGHLCPLASPSPYSESQMGLSPTASRSSAPLVML